MFILRADTYCVRVISGLGVYAGLSYRPDFRRSLRLALRQAHADYTPGPVDTRMIRQPTGVVTLPVPVRPVSGSSLEPHTLPVHLTVLVQVRLHHWFDVLFSQPWSRAVRSYRL